jgi:hypothetical protein
MRNRDLREAEQAHYFKSSDLTAQGTKDGVREMRPLAPFVISGGRNTERYYFKHINDLSDKYKFNVRPEYFGDESDYKKVFPIRIKEILSKNIEAKIFCVFDMDTIYKESSTKKHQTFVQGLDKEIRSGQVVLCDSMPSFEFWLLLHFTTYEGLLKSYSEVSQLLAPYIKSFFEDSLKRFKSLIKSEKHLQNPNWVRRLLNENRIEQAIERAKTLEHVRNKEELQSYSNVYKAFEYKE